MSERARGSGAGDVRDGDDAAVAAAFLDRYLRDLDEGGPRELAHYQALFPGHEELVARELAALAPDDARDDAPPGGASGTRIGPYRVVRELGRGGQGVVHLAEDARLKRRVALKVLEGLVLAGERLARFRREAEVASRLEHPGICAVFDSGVADGTPYIAMRYVEGRTLAAEIAALRTGTDGRERRLARDEVERVLALFEAAARALHAAHEAGVVHRDVKPGNLMVADDGAPVLLDFGLARAAEADGPTLTRTGDVFGTPAYMAPEQLRGAAPVDARADVYALGATLYERLCLTPPFEAPTREGLFRAILEDDPVDPASRVRGLPRDLGVVVRTALAKDPDRRYRTALDLAEDLRRVRAREPILARDPGALERAWRWVDRNRVVASLAAGLILALATGLAVTARLLNSSEEARSDLARMTVELEAALADAERGRLSERAERVERLVAQGFQEAFGASVGRSAETFEAALALDPSNEAALLGRAFVETGRGPGRVEAVLDRFAGARADDPDVLWLRAQAAERAGRTREAEELHARAGDGDSHLRLYLKGLRAVDGFMSADPEDARRAVSLFRRACLQAPRPQYPYVHSLLMAASYARDRETMEEAAAALERRWPELPGTWDAIAQFFLPLDPARGVGALHRCLELKPAAAPCCGLAYEALSRGAEDEALAWFDRGIELEPTFAPAWFMKGELLARRGDAAGARACFVSSLERDPGYAPVHDALRAAYAALGELDGAREELERIARASRDAGHGRGEARALATLARIEQERGEPSRARGLLARAASADPSDAATLDAWCAELLAADDLAAASADARALADAHPDAPRAWLVLGRVRRAADDPERALEALERGLALRPDDPELARERDLAAGTSTLGGR